MNRPELLALSFLLFGCTAPARAVDDTRHPRIPQADSAIDQQARFEDALLELRLRTHWLQELGEGALDLDLSIENGIAVLQGTCPSEEVHEQAVEFADATAGIEAIVDEIEIGERNEAGPAAPSLEDRRTDLAVRTHLVRQLGALGFSVGLSVREGVVILDPSAIPEGEHAGLRRQISALEGVRRVEEQAAPAADAP